MIESGEKQHALQKVEAQQRALQENTPLRAVPVQMQMNLNNTSADESEPKFN